MDITLDYCCWNWGYHWNWLWNFSLSFLSFESFASSSTWDCKAINIVRMSGPFTLACWKSWLAFSALSFSSLSFLSFSSLSLISLIPFSRSASFLLSFYSHLSLPCSFYMSRCERIYTLIHTHISLSLLNVCKVLDEDIHRNLFYNHQTWWMQSKVLGVATNIPFLFFHVCIYL